MTDPEREALRASINEYHASAAQTAESVPLPPGAPAGLTAIQQLTLHQNWVDYIYARPALTWTPVEKAAIRFAANKVLKAL